MKLHSTILGSGRPLIILHGVLGMSDNWQSLGKKWAEDYQVHLVDARNHGKSPHSDDFSYEIMADDLAEYMDDHELEKALVLGHSMGGKVAMLLATLAPERMEKMIVVDIAPRDYEAHHGPVLKALRALDLENISSRREAQEQFAPELDEGTRQFLLKSLYWRSKDRLDWRFNLEAVGRELERGGGALPPNAVYQGPVLFIRGGDSDYIRDEDEATINEHFPQAKICSIAGAGHWVHAQKPSELDREVRAFLED